MRTAVIVILALYLTGCAGYKPTLQGSPAQGSIALYVLPVLHQEEISVQAHTSADATLVGASYAGVGGALVGSMIDSAVNESKVEGAERKAEVLRVVASKFDLRAHLRETVSLESGDGWHVATVGEVTSDTEIRKQVAEAFTDNGIDTVLVLSATYELTSSVDQMIVSIEQQVYPRSLGATTGKANPAVQRIFSYQSPMHFLVSRPFGDGEREAVKRQIESEYERLVVMQPDREYWLRRSLKDELDEIENATEAPETLAVADLWQPGLLRNYLGQSQRHLRRMLEIDWNEREMVDMSIPNLGHLYAVLPTEARAKQRGVLMDTLDDNEIYRMKLGDLYSVPPAPELSVDEVQ